MFNLLLSHLNGMQERDNSTNVFRVGAKITRRCNIIPVYGTLSV